MYRLRDPEDRSPPRISFDPDGNGQPRDQYGEYYDFREQPTPGIQDTAGTSTSPVPGNADVPLGTSCSEAPLNLGSPHPTHSDKTPGDESLGSQDDQTEVDLTHGSLLDRLSPPTLPLTMTAFVRLVDAEMGTWFSRHMPFFEDHGIGRQNLDQVNVQAWQSSTMSQDEIDLLLIVHWAYMLGLQHRRRAL